MSCLPRVLCVLSFLLRMTLSYELFICFVPIIIVFVVHYVVVFLLLRCINCAQCVSWLEPLLSSLSRYTCCVSDYSCHVCL